MPEESIKPTTVRRSLETGGSATGGTVLAYQIVALLTEVFPKYFEAYPSLEGLTVTAVTAFVTVVGTLSFAKWAKRER